MAILPRHRGTMSQLQDVEAPPPPPPLSPLFTDYLDVTATLAAPPPPLDFVLPGLLAGTMGVLVSPGGAGKSMLALAMAVSVAAGRDVWNVVGEDPKAGPVIVVSAEDPSVILARRLHALRDSAPGIFDDPATAARLRLKAVHGRSFSLGSWDGVVFIPSVALDILEREIAELRPRLVVFDTLNRCLAGISENDNAAMGRIVSEVERIIAPTSSAALILHHTSKATALQGQGDQQQAARGAGAITDNARWQMNLMTMTKEDAEARSISADDRRSWVRAIVPKCNYAATPPDRWLRREEGGILRLAEPPVAVAKGRSGQAPVRQKPRAEASDESIPW
jgi:RecA-family ATPase